MPNVKPKLNWFDVTEKHPRKFAHNFRIPAGLRLLFTRYAGGRPEHHRIRIKFNWRILVEKRGLRLLCLRSDLLDEFCACVLKLTTSGPKSSFPAAWRRPE